jgi:hypothetical protein
LPIRSRFLWPALAGASLVVLAVALAGAQPAQAVDPVGSPFRLGTGVPAPNDPGNNVTALTSSAGTTLDVENNSTPISPAGAFAIYAVASQTGGLSTGVYGKTNSNGPGSAGVNGLLNQAVPGAGSAGVYGTSTSTTSEGPGVYGLHSAPIGTAPAVVGETFSTSVDAVGVKGIVNTPSPASGAAALRGAIITDPNDIYATGIWGSHNGGGWGVYGQSNLGAGVVGASTQHWAGLFYGNVLVNGTVYKSAGAFKIDHPLDPAHKFLNHSFVESPDMKDVYDGIATTNAKGFAVVKLPNWFEALNRTFRYQLTSLSGLQNVAVAKEISHNQFTIQSQKPHSRVSWQVTGIRHDAYANAHRIPVVQEKPQAAQGRYLHPELFGKPMSKSVNQQSYLYPKPAAPLGK